jgi:hypothetical protein
MKECGLATLPLLAEVAEKPDPAGFPAERPNQFAARCSAPLDAGQGRASGDQYHLPSGFFWTARR